MAVTTAQKIKRRGGDHNLKALGVAATRTLYGGTLAFEDAGGDASDVKVDANTTFLGVVCDTADNSAGVDGDKNAEFYTDGEFELSFPSGGLVAANVGADVHASDNYTATLTATANPKIGVLTKVVSATVALVQIRGLGQA